MDPATYVLIGPVAMLAGYVTYRLRLLSASGAIAATAFGLCLLVLGDGRWLGLALAFFIPSSALSKVGRGRKEDAGARVEKGSRRDAGQVLANGGAAWLALGLYALWPGEVWALGFAGALAAASADTWATEVGGLSRKMPRMITTGRPVPPGTSGGVTLLGSGASLAGALFIALVAQALGLASGWGVAIVVLAGVIGSLTDSIAGATVQALYQDGDGSVTERHETAGQPHVLIRGAAWITNDVVNLVATLAGLATAAALGGLPTP